MLLINANDENNFTRHLLGWYKWYDEVWRDAYLRYGLGCTAAGNKTSVGSNDTQPASAGKFITIRGLDFAGILSVLPEYQVQSITLNTLLEINRTGTKGIQTNSTTTLTTQKIIQNYLLNKIMENSSIEMLQFTVSLNYNVTAGGVVSTFNNTSWTFKLKSVNSAWTITTLNTTTNTFANKSQNTGWSTDTALVTITGITYNPGDMLFIELTIQSDITSWHASETTSMFLSDNPTGSFVYITYWN